MQNLKKRKHSNQSKITEKLMNIFISSDEISSKLAQSLLIKLREEKFNIFHSPIAPKDGNDLRWQDWYKKGLKVELSKAEKFIAIITKYWDSSSWMATENNEVEKLLSQKDIYF